MGLVPRKKWLRNLKNIPDEEFDACNLESTGQSVWVFRQLRYEGKWSHKDVEELLKIVINITCIQDPTASLVTQKQFEKEIYSYAYTLYDPMVKTEPIQLGILTNCLNESSQ